MSEAVPKGESALLRLARDKFVATFGRSPVAAAAAPSRVNLIGDHIDYCEGFVLPVVICLFIFHHLIHYQPLSRYLFFRRNGA